uniref:Tetratricopeptide repeat protein n=1 Tax=Neobodo designis TaxID=312471 RepID=A0A7S1W200_NEODS
MPKNPEKAQKAKEKKERKLLEQQMKQSREKVDEAKLLMDPSEPKVPPNFVKAISVLDSAIELWGENCDAYRLRGECHRENKSLDNAIEDFSAALTIDENSLQALEGRATCFLALAKWDAAISDFSRMIEVAPHQDHAYNMRATARLQKRAPGLRLRNAELASVIEDFSQALKLNPNNFHATCNLARCYDEHNMFEEAIEQYTHALKLKDDYLYAVYRRGVAALALVETRREAAAKAESRAVAAEEVSAPTEAEVRALLDAEKAAETAAAEEQRLLQAAVADLSRIIPAEDEHTELPCVLHRSACFILLGQADRAEADVKIGASHLDPIQGDELKETTFGGTPAFLLKEALTIRKSELAALKQRDRRPTTVTSN